MADQRVNPMSAVGANMFKEAVCINAGRIYDSCSEKDVAADLRVYFTDCTQPIIDQAISIKCKEVEILNVYVDVEPVPFNKGFFSVDMTFFFGVTLGVLNSPMSEGKTVHGVAIHQKKVILYGSEGNVKTFSSTDNRSCMCKVDSNDPKAMLQVVDPICLSSRITDLCNCDSPHPIGYELPASVCSRFDGDFSGVTAKKAVYITLGLFTIVQIERTVQMMIPAYDFCVPDKEGWGANHPKTGVILSQTKECDKKSHNDT